jgi:hypothetical protein
MRAIVRLHCATARQAIIRRRSQTISLARLRVGARMIAYKVEKDSNDVVSVG